MIPKIIHYCWFGGKEMPPLVQKCIKSWKEHLPDYEFKLWNEENFDINSSEWCKGAYENKKYAFVADYVRLIALYKNGGIYLDTDEKMEKSLNPFVEKDIAFMGFEDGKVLSMGVMGFPPKHHIIAELLEYYNQPFSMDIITQNTSNVVIVTNYLGSWLPYEAKQKLDRRKKWYWKLSKWIWVHIGLQKLKKCITTNLNRKALHNY